MNDDKRKCPRIKIELMAQIILGKEDFIYSKANNISETGLSFSTHETIKPNTIMEVMVTLSFKNNKHKTINCEGIVKYCNEEEHAFNSGMKFTYISDAHKKILKTFINEAIS